MSDPIRDATDQIAHNLIAELAAERDALRERAEAAERQAEQAIDAALRLERENRRLRDALEALVCGDPTCERCALGYAALAKGTVMP